jgi:hypothetical protein
MSRDPRNPNADPLALFGAEPAPPPKKDQDAGPDPLALFRAEPVPPPATNEIDWLIDAVAAGGRGAGGTAEDAATDGTSPPATAERLPRARGAWLLQPAMLRWTAVTLSAFVVGAVIAQWGFRLLERDASPVSRTLSNEAAPAARLPSRQIAGAASAALPRGTAPTSIPRLDDVVAGLAPSGAPPAAEGPAAPPIAVSPAPAPAPAPTAPPSPPPTAPPSPALPPAAAGGTEVPRAPAVVDPKPLERVAAPAVSSTLSPVGETVRPAPPVMPPVGPPTMPPVNESAAPRAVAVRAAMETAVRGALQQYAAAYQNMNVMATAEVWPSVDRRALTRAFATLKSTALAFDSCDVSLAEARATVRCLGTVQFVRKVGNPTPRSEHQQWIFTMGRSGTEWKIESVVASQVSAPTVAPEGTDAERMHRQ